MDSDTVTVIPSNEAGGKQIWRFALKCDINLCWISKQTSINIENQFICGKNKSFTFFEIIHRKNVAH
jgi:hypothetical protein